MQAEKKQTDAQVRQAQFDARCAEMAGKGYRMEAKTFTPSEASSKGILFPLLFIVVAVGAFYLRWGAAVPALWDANVLLLLVGIVGSIFVHEGIHGLTWSRFCAGGLADVHIGLDAKAMMPYCHCKQPLDKAKYLLGVLMPVAVLGGGFFIASMIVPRIELMMLAALNLLIAGGDMLIAWETRGLSGVEVLDHPVLPGFVYFRKGANA